MMCCLVFDKYRYYYCFFFLDWVYIWAVLGSFMGLLCRMLVQKAHLLTKLERQYIRKPATNFTLTRTSQKIEELKRNLG